MVIDFVMQSYGSFISKVVLASFIVRKDKQKMTGGTFCGFLL